MFVPMLVLAWLAADGQQDLTPGTGADKRERPGLSDRDNRVTPVVRVVRDVGPAVVHIKTEIALPPGYLNFLPGEGAGSGVIIDPEGYVITNEHVVRGAKKIEIYLQGDDVKHPYRGDLVNADPENDLALLKIDRREPFPYVKFCNDELMIGETVIAIGNPTGLLADTVTTGVLSAIGRDIDIENRKFHNLLQSDAAINPGNSGGPLLNVNGELIGINNAIVRLNQNISFAIPASQVQATLNERLLNVDRTRRFWLGMRIEPRDGALRVKAVDRGGPAAKSDIQPGDVIVEVDGKPVADERAYAKAILPLAAGQTVPMRVRRGKKDRELRLELLSYDDRVIWERLGVAVRESRVNGEPTVQVQSVDPDGPAAEVKIRPNDYLWSVIVKRRDPWGGVLPDDWQLLSKGRFREIVETFATSRQKVLPVRVVRGEQWLWGEIALR